MPDDFKAADYEEWQNGIKRAAIENDLGAFRDLLKTPIGQERLKGLTLNPDLDEHVGLMMEGIRKDLKEGEEYATNLPEGRALTEEQIAAVEAGITPSTLRLGIQVQKAQRRGIE